MNGYKTATVKTESTEIMVNLTLMGHWKALNKDDYNFLCSLDGALEAALSRAFNSENGVGSNKKSTVLVTLHK